MTAEKRRSYNPSAILAARREDLAKRGRRDAEAIARRLVGEFGAKRVWLFGSLAGRTSFRRSSDIDLAVEGLDPDLFFKALGITLQMTDFPVDLKPMESLREEWRARIREEGVVIA